jgi:hypothetical protein
MEVRWAHMTVQKTDWAHDAHNLIQIFTQIHLGREGPGLLPTDAGWVTVLLQANASDRIDNAKPLEIELYDTTGKSYTTGTAYSEHPWQPLGPGLPLLRAFMFDIPPVSLNGAGRFYWQFRVAGRDVGRLPLVITNPSTLSFRADPSESDVQVDWAHLSEKRAIEDRHMITLLGVREFSYITPGSASTVDANWLTVKLSVAPRAGRPHNVEIAFTDADGIVLGPRFQATGYPSLLGADGRLHGTLPLLVKDLTENLELDELDDFAFEIWVDNHHLKTVDYRLLPVPQN